MYWKLQTIGINMHLRYANLWLWAQSDCHCPCPVWFSRKTKRQLAYRAISLNSMLSPTPPHLPQVWLHAEKIHPYSNINNVTCVSAINIPPPPPPPPPTLCQTLVNVISITKSVHLSLICSQLSNLGRERERERKKKKKACETISIK